MIDEDEIVVQAKQIADELSSGTETLRDSALKAIASVALPMGVGSALGGILTDLADKRWKERVVDLLQLFAERLSRLTAVIDSGQYYSSDEFQALLIEAIDQQRTNRYEKKRSLLAEGLANSGTRTFILEKDKETFFRVLRDLDPEDLRLLEELMRPVNASHLGLVLKDKTLERVSKATTINVRFYRLQGLGLLTTFQRLPSPNLSGANKIEDQGTLNRFIANALGAEPQIVINISDFGQRFLAFMVADKQSSVAEGSETT